MDARVYFNENKGRKTYLLLFVSPPAFVASMRIDLICLVRARAAAYPLRRCLITLGLAMGILLAGNLAGCDGSGQAPTAVPAAPPPVQVKASQPLRKEVEAFDEYTGRIEAIATVEIRARVDGYLERVNFKDGDKVKQGDLLFVVDPRPYRAELDRAQAELERSRTRLDLARNDLQRAEKLRRSKAISEEEYDSRSKGSTESGAAVRSAEAAVQTARLNLDFTEIRAPISGRIGRQLVNPGNLVKSDDTLLAILSSIDPIHVYVDADERAVLKYRRLAQTGNGHETRIPAELALLDETGFPHRGFIDYLDPRLDTGTGTLRMRGVFDNPGELLSPGFFARVRIPGSAPYRALLIPERALGTDQGQKFVWIVGKENSVEYRRVVPGPQFGPLRAIAEGLQAEDLVVVEGIQKLRPGAQVTVERIPAAEAH